MTGASGEEGGKAIGAATEEVPNRAKAETGAPRVFISYAFESPEHKRWVGSLATDLRRNGVDTILDQWDLPLGGDVALFMEEGIRTAGRVLLICTPTYARKANEGKGGVGYERLVVTGELAQRVQTTKFICVLRTGSYPEAVPVFAQTKRFVEFTDDARYELALEELLRDIHQAPSDPKPLLGPNPFSGQSASPIFLERAMALAEDIVPSEDLEELYARAVKLLRQKDLFGWRRLLRETRRQVAARLLAWRGKLQGVKIEEATWPSWRAEAVQTYEPLFLLALSAVESGIPELADQRALLDDCLEVPNWDLSGLTVVVSMPNVIGYTYHHLLGSFLVSSRVYDAALRLLTTLTRVQGNETQELCAVREMWWGSDELGRMSEEQWNSVAQRYRPQGWLAHFFVREEEYVESLRAYGILASLVELGRFIAQGDGPELLKENVDLVLSVPPIFVVGGEPKTAFLAALRRALPDRRTVVLLADTCSIKLEDLYRYWPLWYKWWLKWHGRGAFFRARSLPQEAPKLP